MKRILFGLIFFSAAAFAHHHETHFVTIQPGLTSDYEGNFIDLDADGLFVWFNAHDQDQSGNDRLFFSEFEEKYWWWRVERHGHDHDDDPIIDSAYCLADGDEHTFVLTCDGHGNQLQP